MAKVALLTGASSGIGYAVAERLAEAGYALVLSSRNPEQAAERLAADHGVTVVPVAGDMADPALPPRLLRACRELGGLDALLLNHGGPPVKPFDELEDEHWEAAFRLLVLGPLRLLRHAGDALRADGGARVVAISSFTVKSPLGGAILSNSLRAALVNALKTAAVEWGPDNVLLNAVGPGYAATERLVSFNQAYAEREGISLEDVDRRTLERIPLRRYADPGEVAELIWFLLSERNGYVSGQQVLADGGLVTAA